MVLRVGTCPFQMLLPQRGPGGRDGSYPKPGYQQGPRREGPSKAGSIHCEADSSAVQTPMLPRHVAKIGSLGWTRERVPSPGVPSPAPRTFRQRWPVGAGEHSSSAARVEIRLKRN